ncbi:putative reverse transcriptase domain-containing protein [Tanacetum coccineum]
MDSACVRSSPFIGFSGRIYAFGRSLVSLDFLPPHHSPIIGTDCQVVKCKTSWLASLLLLERTRMLVATLQFACVIEICLLKDLLKRIGIRLLKFFAESPTLILCSCCENDRRIVWYCDTDLKYPEIEILSVGWPVAESQGGGTGVRVGRGGMGRGPKEGNNERVDDLNGQGNDQGMGANEGVEEVNRNVGNQGNMGNQNSNVVNENVQENVRNVIVNGNRIEKMEYVQDMSGCSVDQTVKYTAGSFVEEFYPSHEMQKLKTELWNHALVGAGYAAYTNRFHELARLVPHLVTPKSRKNERYMYGLAPQICVMVAATEPKTMQKAVQIFGALTDEAVRNGSIKKVEKRGNIGEPSKDKNGRDDNKRTRTGNAFASTANPIGRENMGTWPKCTTCNSYHTPGGSCRTCFNYNRPGHLAKDCRSVPRNVNHVNARNPSVRACYECGSTDHVRTACPRLNRA